MTNSIFRGLVFGSAILGMAIAAGTGRAAAACDGINDLTCAISPMERLRSGGWSHEAAGSSPDEDAAAQAPEPLRVIMADPQGGRAAHRARRSATGKARAAQARATDTDLEKAQAGEESPRTPDAAHSPADQPRAATQDGAPTANAPSPAENATEAAFVEPHTYNDIDRLADSPQAAQRAVAMSAPAMSAPAMTAPAPSACAAAPADPPAQDQRIAIRAAEAGNDPVLDAMAMMPAAQREVRAWWQDMMPFGETSVIGQIFVLLGGLLTIATAFRLFMI